MMNARRWIVVIVALAAIIALIGVVRGTEHHRGDEVGALPAGALPWSAAEVFSDDGA